MGRSIYRSIARFVMHYFYSHLIKTESITAELDGLDLSDRERLELASLIDSTLDQVILDEIFSQINHQEKIILLEHLKHRDDDQIWGLLRSRIEGIEGRIKRVAEELTEELKKDIWQAKGIKNNE